MTPRQIIYGALTIATGIVADSDNSPLADGETVAETLFPVIARKVIVSGLDNDSRAVTSLREHAVTLTNGAGPLPAGIVDEGWAFNTVRFAGVNAKYNGRISPVRFRYDFDRPLRRELAYWCIDGNLLRVKLPLPALPTALNEDVTLSALTVPDVTANVDTDTGLDLDFDQDILTMLAGTLRGEEPWKKLISDYPLLMEKQKAKARAN